MSAVTSNTSSEQTARVIVLCFLVFLSLATSADSLTGKAVKITDGDTRYVLDANYQEYKIRLAGIDAPERRPTCFAGTSGTNLRLLLPRVLIFIVFRFLESSKMLRYDRLADIRQAYATDELFLADLLPHFAGLKPLNQEVQ